MLVICFHPLVTKPKNLLKLVGYLDIYVAVLVAPLSALLFFPLALVIGVVFLTKSTWHSPGHNIKVPSLLELLFLVKEEGRVPSTLALPPGMHLSLWFPSFTFCSYYTCDSDLSPSFLCSFTFV